jgi:hypothetical protein
MNKVNPPWNVCRKIYWDEMAEVGAATGGTATSGYDNIS